MSTEDPGLQEQIPDEVMVLLGKYRSFKNPPHLAGEIHRLIKAKTGVFDPYQRIKRKDLETALSLYPRVREFVQAGGDRLERALKAAAVGNTLDSAIFTNYDIDKGLGEELEKPFAISDLPSFRDRLGSAKTLLLIGDNTGETVFDRLLLEELAGLEITYAVRSAPIINDATAADAEASGLGEYARILPTGCSLPGVILDQCSREFHDAFTGSDIVISKGQGNYETLSGEKCGRGIFFLLKVKCPVLSKLIGVGLNEYVFKYF